MTLKQTLEKIESRQYLIGQIAPKWQSPILEMIPAPANATFTKYIQLYKKTGDYKKAISKISAKQFDILLIFRTPKLHLSLVYEWYGFFYTEDNKLEGQEVQYSSELKQRYFKKYDTPAA